MITLSKKLAIKLIINSINMDGYDGPGNSLKEIFEPNDSVSGKGQVFRTPDEVIPLALMYLGYDQCNENPQQMKEVQALLLKLKPHVKTYNSETMIANLSSGEVMVSSHWDGYLMKNLTENNVPKLKFDQALRHDVDQGTPIIC